MDKFGKIKHHGRKVWYFLWYEDSLWSWLANIIIAFLVIRYLFYPLLGLVLGTGYPIVAVVSESMEHGLHNGVICGQDAADFRESFANYWLYCGTWYEKKGITKEQFREFPFPNGFDKGDVIILWRAGENNLKAGDILIFKSDRPQPIIHRIVKVKVEDGNYLYQTKGDHNRESSPNEESIDRGRIYGQGVIRIPYLGWLKILFVDAVRPLGITIKR